MTAPKAEVFVSVVAPLWNDADLVAGFIRDTAAVLSEHFSQFEVVLVDDGSTDATTTAVREAIAERPQVRLIRLSRRFGTEIAISAGLESAIGDFVVVMMPETDPPALIPKMVEQARAGASIVYGIRGHRRGQALSARVGASLFYWLANRIFRLNLPADATHFRALSRQVVNALIQIRDRNRYLQTLIASVGYQNQAVVYEPVLRRTPPRRRTLLELFTLAMNILVSTSLKPLHAAAGVGVLAVAANAAYLCYVVAIYAFKPNVAAGWTTESLMMAVMFGSLSLLGTALAAYLARLLDETADRPLYFVLEEVTSAEARDLVPRNLVAEPVERRAPP